MKNLFGSRGIAWYTISFHFAPFVKLRAGFCTLHLPFFPGEIHRFDSKPAFAGFGKLKDFLLRSI